MLCFGSRLATPPCLGRPRQLRQDVPARTLGSAAAAGGRKLEVGNGAPFFPRSGRPSPSPPSLVREKDVSGSTSNISLPHCVCFSNHPCYPEAFTSAVPILPRAGGGGISLAGWLSWPGLEQRRVLRVCFWQRTAFISSYNAFASWLPGSHSRRDNSRLLPLSRAKLRQCSSLRTNQRDRVA